MDRQLFAIAQIVTVARRSLSGPRTADQFRVVRRYLIEKLPAMYHVRSIADCGERMVPEDELSGVMPKAFDRASRPSNVLQLFPNVVRLNRGMTTWTTVADVTFTRRFRLPNMDRACPPGIYQIEIDREALDTVSRLANRRTATRIRLQSPGVIQLLTIDPQDLEAALVEDAATAPSQPRE